MPSDRTERLKLENIPRNEVGVQLETFAGKEKPKLQHNRTVAVVIRVGTGPGRGPGPGGPGENPEIFCRKKVDLTPV